MDTWEHLTGLFARSVPKAFRQGTHRAVAPEETLARVRPYLPVMGITRIANVTGLDSIGIPVVVVCRPNSRSLSVSQGKASTLIAAKVSGVMESIETYHAEHMVQPLLFGRFQDLRFSHNLIEVEELPFVPDTRYHPALDLLWAEGFDVITSEPTWVPYELVHTNFTLPQPTGSGCFNATSNGLSSGNDLLEAVSHGISEVVERDATALWYLLDDDSRESTRVDLSTVDDPECCEVLAQFERANVMVAVWETTSDVGIASFFCSIAERTDDPLRGALLASGAGCHPARHIALLRSLTEAAQSRLTAISGARDDLFRSSYSRVNNRDNVLRERSRLAALGAQRDYHLAPTFEGETFNDDVNWQIDRLHNVGVRRVVVVDLRRREFRIPVVRVVIPGLEGFSETPDYAPGKRALARVEGLA
jgi:YcaO-like protein with predicted kinase domain